MNELMCQLCKKEIEDYSDAYEYRGFLFHAKCFDEGIKRVDEKRAEVMDETKRSVQSQRLGEFVNNHNLKLEDLAEDGLPKKMKIKELKCLQDYEKGIL